jgi:O-acetyl-ADP-ribose deacetylase (regulator of RNase III)
MSEASPAAGARPRASYQKVIVAVSRKTFAELIAPGVFDVLVSSDDTTFQMGSGVSAELARLGGREYVADVRSRAPARVGDVVTTSAGALPARHVLHAVTVDWSSPVRPTERTMRQLAREIFARCESLEAESVLVPLVASGSVRVPRETSAAILVEVLMQHLANRSVLRHVALSVPDPAAYDACHALLPALLAGVTGRPRVEFVFASPPSLPAAPAGDAAATRVLPPSAPAPPRPAAAARPPVPRATPVDADAAPPDATARGATASGFGELLRKVFKPRTSGPAPPARPAPADPESLDSFPTLAAPGPRVRTEYRAQDESSDSETLPAARPGAAAPAAPVPDHARPVLARRYVLLEELGRGGFGVVHLSWDLVLRRVVAIKQLRSDRTAMDALRREAAIALDLAHDNIVRTHHFEPETAEAGAFIVMEYVPWPTAERWLATGGDQLPPPMVVAELGVRMCDALEYAHARQVLHLDLKPANLFVDVAAERVKLSDFGLARISSPAGRVLPGFTSGTPAYMAPEQRQPGARLTTATDLYQLAATLWDLLVGETPGPGEEPPEHAEPARRRVLEAIAPALSREMDSRPRSASEFRGLLAATL